MTPEQYRALLADAWAAHLAERAPGAPTVISTFAGGGGSSLGYSMAGYRELVAADFDPHACATLRTNFPDAHVYEGDVTNLSVNQALDLAGLAPGELDVLERARRRARASAPPASGAPGTTAAGSSSSSCGCSPASSPGPS